MADPGDHRIGDVERQQAIDLLRTHAGAGRLTLDEFGDLAAQVYAAQTFRELEAVAENLPAGLLAEQQPPLATAPPPNPIAAGPTPGVPTHRKFIAVLSGSNARGQWRVPRSITAFAFWGGVVLDMREAIFESQVVEVTAWAIMGGVTVLVNEGVAVEVDGMVVMGGTTEPRSVDVTADSPVVRVHARGLWGGVTAIVKRPSRRGRKRGQRSHGPGGRGWQGDWHEWHGWGPPHRVGSDTDTEDEDREDAIAGRAGDGAERASGRVRAEPPLALPQRILDEVADALARIQAGPGEPLGPVGGKRAPSRHRSRSAGPATPPQPPAPPAPGATPVPPAPPGSSPEPEAVVDAEPVASAQPAGAAAVEAPEARRNGLTPSGTLTMMVTDIVDSTVYAVRMGDQRWIEVLGRHNTIVREQVARHGGTEVKAQGDGFLIVFTSARRAILAAVDVQRALSRFRDDNPDTPVEVRVGLHTGEIVDVDGDVFGQNVVVAVRITDHAAPGEIVVSGLTRDLTVAGGDLSFGPADEVELKGLDEPWRIHRVSWSHAPA
jgi:class 3 adenylate cyclase